MNHAVLIKSYPNGLSVILEEGIAFDTLLLEVEKKFKESGKFFQNAKLALSLEGRKLTSEEEKQIVDCICQVSGLDIACVVGKDEQKNQMYLKALQQLDVPADQNNGQFYKGTLKNGQVLETESSIVILGDVYPGSTIVSTKDIVILGGLYGEAYAGGNGESGHFIVALEMSPEKLKIGDLKYRNEKAAKWPVKPKTQPKIAYIQNDKIIIKPITKELLTEYFL
ncbi:MAG: septum site-determining protein MinC [Lachnospiraceae bacterium]